MSNVYKKLEKLLEKKELISEDIKVDLSTHNINNKEHLVTNLKELIEKHDVSQDVVNS